jgi:flagellar hook-basal body complex protein FliE
MTERIGKSALAREAILAALEARRRQAAEPPSVRADFAALLPEGPAATRSAEPSQRPTGLGELVREGVESVDREVGRAAALDEALVSGRVSDFHEVALALKQADLSFKFAVEVRNKLIDAYREVMRMTV